MGHHENRDISLIYSINNSVVSRTQSKKGNASPFQSLDLLPCWKGKDFQSLHRLQYPQSNLWGESAKVILGKRGDDDFIPFQSLSPIQR